MKSTDKQHSANAEPREAPPRRGFLMQFITVIVGGLVMVVPLLAGLAVFFDPLRKRKAAASGDGPGDFPTPEGGGGKWLRVATIDALPSDGVPRQFAVISDQVDAWNRTPNQPIGSLYLRREPGTEKIEALNAICPHAGCFVAVADEPGRKVFRCPCHTSAFSLDGEKLNLPGATNPSPRNMDPLTVKLASGGEIWVYFQNFYPGTHDRKVKA